MIEKLVFKLLEWQIFVGEKKSYEGRIKNQTCRYWHQVKDVNVKAVSTEINLEFVK